MGTKNLHLDSAKSERIIAQLRQKKYAVSIADQWILSLLGGALPGWVYLGTPPFHRFDFLYRLTARESHYHIVTLIPGETTVVFLEQLARKLDRNATRLHDQFRRQSLWPEAAILADTYHIPMHLSERGILHLLLSQTLARYKQLSLTHLKRWDPKGWQHALTVASIIQKEAANVQEMPQIASVIYNRLRKKMRLQMDGTLNYGSFSHTPVTPERIRTDPTTFNTYRHRGLPKSPVCNVSVAAIKAALKPAKTPYLYFMKNAHGTHDFSATYRAHLHNVHERKNSTKE